MPALFRAPLGLLCGHHVPGYNEYEEELGVPLYGRIGWSRMSSSKSESITEGTSAESPARMTSPEKAQALTHLLDDWLADTSGYDERTWPALKEGIESSRLSSRKRFRG